LNLSTSDKFNDICKLLLQSHIQNLKIISVSTSSTASVVVIEEEKEVVTAEEAYYIKWFVFLGTLYP